MVLEQRMQDMEDEVNLLKAEVKATLLDIREHILNPDINAVLSTARVPTVGQSRSIGNNGRDQEVEGMDSDRRSAPRSSLTEESVVKARGDEEYSEGPESAQLQSDEQRRHHGAQDTIDPNLIASLLRWVVLTRKDIGHEELDAFMEICSLSGGLPEGIRQLVCRIAKTVPMVSSTPNASIQAGRLTVRDDAIIDENSYSRWSDLMLQLHGIIGPACFLSESERNSTEA